MSTSVSVNTFTHSTAYVTDKMLSSLKWIIFWSGLDHDKLTRNWASLELGIKTWLRSRHLERVTLEIYLPGMTMSLSHCSRPHCFFPYPDAQLTSRQAGWDDQRKKHPEGERP